MELASKRAWRLKPKNKELIRLYSKKYYQENKERIKLKWMMGNKSKSDFGKYAAI